MKALKKKIILFKHYSKEDPYFFKRFLVSLYENALRVYFSFRKPKGIHVLNEDWDFLIILDACRYDTFKKLNFIKGKLEKKISLGSNTVGWFRRNFTKPYYDIVYIMGNPKIITANSSGVKFFHQENVWDYGWDDLLNTVPPENVSEAALKLSKKYPDKRMIIHYVQPHVPYIGKTLIKDKKGKILDGLAISDEVKFNNYPISKIKKAYEENLKIVLDDVNKLIKGLRGKIVVTADHGELFGEWGLYFHPEGIYIKKLIEIPWLKVKK